MDDLTERLFWLVYKEAQCAASATQPRNPDDLTPRDTWVDITGDLGRWMIANHIAIGMEGGFARKYVRNRDNPGKAEAWTEGFARELRSAGFEAKAWTEELL